MGLQKIEVLPELTIEELVKQIIHSPADRIVLEVPAETELLNNEINLRLLKFYAEEESKEILINAADTMLIMLAKRMGLATISDDASVSSRMPDPDSFEPEEPARASQTSPALQAGFNLRQGGLLVAIPLALFTFVLAVWWFLQPKATVLVYPKEESLDFVTAAEIGPAISETVPEAGKVSARVIEKTSKLVVRTVTTGVKTVGVTAATGRLTLINPSSQPVVVPKQSVVLARNGVRFFTERDVLVPKKSAKYRGGVPVGENYGQAEVSIIAEQKGTIGNLPVRALNRIEGKLLRSLQVVNLTPTVHGEDKQISVVTLEDVKKGESEARRQLELIGPGELSSLFSKDYLFIPELVQCEVVRLVDSPEIGAESDEVQTTLEYRVAALAPPVAELSKLLSYRFEKAVPQGFRPKDRKIQLLAARVTATGRQRASLQLSGRGHIQGILSADQIRQWLKGKSISQARAELIRRKEIADFKIDIPGGGKNLPGFGFQIKVLLPAGPK